MTAEMPPLAGVLGREGRGWRVSRALQFLAVVITLLAVFGIGHQLVTARTAIVESAEQNLSRLSVAFAEQTGRALETADLILREAVEDTSRDHPDRASDTFARLIHGVHPIEALCMADADGRVLAVAWRDGRVNPGPLPELLETVRKLATTHDPQLRVSAPFREGAKWSVLLARGVLGPGGEWRGIVAAHLDLDYFENFYRDVGLGEYGAITLFRRDGVLLVRYPHVDRIVGQSFASYPPFQEILSQQDGGALEMPSPLDGADRIFAIHAVRSFPLAVGVSLDEGEALARWRHHAMGFGASALAVVAALVLLLLALAWRSRQIERLLDASKVAYAAAEDANARLLVQMEERARAEAALAHAQRIEALGQVTGGVAHDFNNLLTVVIGNADLMQMTAGDDPDLGPPLATIRSAAERGAALTMQLLAFARRQPLRPVPLNINAVISGMDGLLHSAVGGRVALVRDFAPDLWPAMVDPTQVELMVLNLAINARDAMPDGGLLTLVTRNTRRGDNARVEDPPAGDYVQLTVADTGTGMTAEVRARAFEPFFTTKGPGRGSGLGLSQVFGLVRQSGGDVSIDTGPGQGTAVHILLPRASQAPAETTAKAAPVPVHGADVTVLLVDDDEAVRRTTASILHGLQYRVLEAEGGKQALAMADRLPRPAVLLTDVAMPEMSGPQLGHVIRQRWPDLPVVYISAYADPGSGTDVPDPRFLVSKPFRPADLVSHIEFALAEASRVDVPSA